MKYNKYIDHTLLKQDATESQIIKLCEEAKIADFASVCVNPSYVRTCYSLLKGSNVMVCSVVGFPLGATSTDSKVDETKACIFEGADEIDMVINIGKLKDNQDKYVQDEISRVKRACGEHTLKVIIETCLLTEEEKIRACLLSKAAGADFVKTSTGFSTGGATAEDIALMRKTVGPQMGVKASGGVKTREAMLKMIDAGATRIGTSNGVELIKE